MPSMGRAERRLEMRKRRVRPDKSPYTKPSHGDRKRGTRRRSRGGRSI